MKSVLWEAEYGKRRLTNLLATVRNQDVPDSTVSTEAGSEQGKRRPDFPYEIGAFLGAADALVGVATSKS